MRYRAAGSSWSPTAIYRASTGRRLRADPLRPSPSPVTNRRLPAPQEHGRSDCFAQYARNPPAAKKFPASTWTPSGRPQAGSFLYNQYTSRKCMCMAKRTSSRSTLSRPPATQAWSSGRLRADRSAVLPQRRFRPVRGRPPGGYRPVFFYPVLFLYNLRTARRSAGLRPSLQYAQGLQPADQPPPFRTPPKRPE
jgi:hypothetical protein